MSKINLTSIRVGNMAFATNINGHAVITDADESNGGNNLGPRPKSLLLSALVGCMGYDVSIILNKMKIIVDEIQVYIEADSKDEDPKTYNYINLIWKFKGKDLPLKKLQEAIDLSHDKYCGVSAMLEKATPINISVVTEE